jgi:sugar/nucleoside kinase (ribokinase family)
MKNHSIPIVVAGHVCLDIIPAFGAGAGGIASLRPGNLAAVGPAVLAGGGPVANTGLALHRLGLPVALMGKVGADGLGGVLLEVFRRRGKELAAGMIVAKGEDTSYTVVLSPPGTDRAFLHCVGANDTFSAGDIDYASLPQRGIFHFGYPPLMRRMYASGGRGLAEVFRRAKGRGLTTSLDMARPDPASESSRADWAAILARALPHVDLFCPSIDEILFLLDRPAFARLEAGSAAAGSPGYDGEVLSRMASRLLDMGAGAVLLKLGDQGLYLRTSASAKRQARIGAIAAEKKSAWNDREILSPCFEVRVEGTTGSGDCTIAGLLAALAKGLSPEAAVTAATAVGACCCEAADSTSGVPKWSAVQKRIREGWPRREVRIALPNWRRNEANGLWFGPGDANPT